MALLLADQGKAESAIEYYIAALKSPYISNSCWFADIAGRQIEELAATMPQEIVAAAQARGEARDLWQTANELLTDLGEPETEAPDPALRR